MRTVVIVDDESEIRHGLRHGFQWEKYGYAIIGEASNGKQALRVIEDTLPDIVLVDIVMPVMNGIELTKELARSYPSCLVVILSNYSDFSYVKQALLNGARNYLLKVTLNEVELMKTLDGLVNDIDRKDYDYHSVEQLLKKSLVQGIDEKYYQEMMAYFTHEHQYFLISDLLFYDDNILISQVLELEALLPYSSFYYVTVQNYVVIFIDTNLSRESLCHKLQDYLKVHLNIHYFAYLSLDLKEKVLYQQELKAGIQALGNRFYLSDSFVVTTTDKVPVNVLPEFDTALFREKLQIVKEEAALDLVNEYVSLMRQNSYDETALKDLFTGVFYQLYHHVETVYPHEMKEYEEKIEVFSLINNSPSLSSLQHEVERQLEHFREFFHLMKDRHSVQFKDQLTTYLMDNASEKLTLKTTADYFHFNYSYFSTYFSQNFDVTFTDYLTQVRIDKAKVLLAENELNISEIASATGFSDVSYFSKVFKKIEGISPSIYRRKGIIHATFN